MKKFLCFSLFVALSVASSIIALDSNDKQIITEIIEGIPDAWNNHQGHGFADGYAQDADFVNIFGMTFTGKQEIEDRHIQILGTFLKGTIFEVIDIKLREAIPGTVIAQVPWTVSNVTKPGIDAKETMTGIFTFVFIKNNSKWEITVSQNTLKANLPKQ